MVRRLGAAPLLAAVDDAARFFVLPGFFFFRGAFFLRFAVAKGASPYVEVSCPQESAGLVVERSLVKFGGSEDYSGKIGAYPGLVTSNNSHKKYTRYGPPTKTHRQDPS